VAKDVTTVVTAAAETAAGATAVTTVGTAAAATAVGATAVTEAEAIVAQNDQYYKKWNFVAYILGVTSFCLTPCQPLLP
jgi:hypothetical protein